MVAGEGTSDVRLPLFVKQTAPANSHRMRSHGLACALLAALSLFSGLGAASRARAPPPPILRAGAGALPALDSYGFPALSDVLPRNGSRVVWGICGPGRIASDFTAALVAMGAQVGAVGAGSLPGARKRAMSFASFYGIPRAYGSYLELARDEEVDVVYIATTNNNHYANAALMLRHGKHVLLEKPATLRLREFDELAALAEAGGLLLVTDYWTRFFPAVKWAREVVASGLLGAVVHLQGDMAFQAVRPPGGDRFTLPALGGGAMLDMGCYLVQFGALWLSPRGSAAPSPWGAHNFTVRALGQVEGGVDMEAAFLLSAGNASASFGTSLKRASDFALSIYCEYGKLELAGPANCPARASYALFQDARQKREPPTPCCGQPVVEERSFVQPLPSYPPALLPRRGYPNGMGFAYVAAALERCLYTPGCRELDELPMGQQRLIVELTAAVLAELGVYYQDVVRM